MICEAEPELGERVWYAYAQRLRLRDALRVAQRAWPEAGLTSEQVAAHLHTHQYIQPSAPGKGLDRSAALQEALTTFPRSWYYLMLALYRAQALSLEQIYRLFYLDHAPDSVQLRERMLIDLQRLSYRSFLFRVWPSTISTMQFDDPGPYFFLGRQAVPLVERLEGLPPGTLPFGLYITSQQQVPEHHLERDTRFLEVLVALRERLYRRTLQVDGRECQVHLAIEHWHAPVQLHTELDSRPFSPSGLVGLRAESPDGALSTLLPVWFEYDRGTDEASEVVDEVLRYPTYYASPAYRERFPLLAQYNTPGPLVVVCEDAYRREEVGRLLGAKLGGRAVPVYLSERSTLVHDPYADGVLVPPGDSDQRFGLLDRIWAHTGVLHERRVFTGTSHLTDPPAAQLTERAAAAAGQDEDAAVDLGTWSPQS